MHDESMLRHVVITNPDGLHMRPIVSFVEAAKKFQSHVTLSRVGAERVDGKSGLRLLSLAAEPGTELVLEVVGPDARQAIDVLANILLTIPSDE